MSGVCSTTGDGRAQSLLELALVLPVALAILLGAASVVMFALGLGGLQSATAEAALVAARAPTASLAKAEATSAFDRLTAAYPLSACRLGLRLPRGFARGSHLLAESHALVRLSWIPGTPTWQVDALATAQIEPYRSR